jgi:predicted cupin superfamily sugar epimerase
MSPRAVEIRDRLALQPHPEGGWYREVYRSSQTVKPDGGRGLRSALTAIYFLLNAGEFSAWHVVQSDECWLHLEGGPLELLTFDPAAHVRHSTRLGPLSESTEPFAVVPAGVWQAARPLGDFTLVQCLVGPGFDFADFRLNRDDAGDRELAQQQLGDWAELL